MLLEKAFAEIELTRRLVQAAFRDLTRASISDFDSSLERLLDFHRVHHDITDLPALR